MMEVVWVISDNDPAWCLTPSLARELGSEVAQVTPVPSDVMTAPLQQINKPSLKISNNARISFCQIVFLDVIEIFSH